MDVREERSKAIAEMGAVKKTAKDLVFQVAAQSRNKYYRVGGVGGAYQQMFHYSQFKRDEFLAHYHKRSNAESVFSMVKRKFGDYLRSKTDVAMLKRNLTTLKDK